jgi:hypothetical protein
VAISVACDATLRLGDSGLDLFVRPLRPEDTELPDFGTPLAAPQTPYTYQEGAHATVQRITRDLLSGKVMVDFPRWTYSKTMPDIGQTQSSAGLVRHEIAGGVINHNYLVVIGTVLVISAFYLLVITAADLLIARLHPSLRDAVSR